MGLGCLSGITTILLGSFLAQTSHFCFPEVNVPDIYPSLEAILDLCVWLNLLGFVCMSYYEFFLIFYWPVLQHSGIFM